MAAYDPDRTCESDPLLLRCTSPTCYTGVYVIRD
jgi:hypothetical protein